MYLMNDTKNNVKTASKDILARLMASEDIAVEHRASAQTASFNTKSRVLTLPIWQNMDDALYDMLVGHEVAHALWTPTDEWGDEMNRFGEKNMARYMTFVNIVEDARIERMIKAKFPGIRRDFHLAYKDLAERDLFEIADRDISELPLIDRLNLQFKIGSFIEVPFSADEQKAIDALEGTKTFQDVCNVAADLFEDHIEDEETQEVPEIDNADEGDAGVPDDAEGEESSDSDTGMPGESSEDAGAGGSDTPTEESSDDPDSGAGQSEIAGDDGADSGASMTDDTDDGSSADSTSAGSTNSEDAGEPTDNVGSTQNAFDRAIRNYTDDSSGDREYFSFPEADLSKIVVDYRDVHKDISKFIGEVDRRGEALASAQRQLKTFENESKKTVNMMAQQFMRRQSADEQHRTSVSKTGILDMNKAISYKWNEDLFLRHEDIADGKNHGLVLFVDWSGSMCDIMEDTIKQMLQMVFFCRKVGIPFEVYSFTSVMSDYPENWSEFSYEDRQEWYDSNKKFDADWLCTDFSLVNYLSSRMNAREMKAGLANMMYLCNCMSYEHRYNQGFDMPRNHGLGSTPLNEAIIAASAIVPNFRSSNNLQIVNTIFLTDGEASGRLRPNSYGNSAWIRDEKTKRVYNATETTSALLSVLNDRTGANTVGIYLNAARSLRSNYYHDYTDEQVASYKKEGFVSTTKAGYTEYFIVKADSKVENDFLDNITADASYTRIKNAFIKASSSRVNSRVLLNRVIDLIAA